MVWYNSYANGGHTFVFGVEVGKVQDNVGDEAALHESQQTTCGKEGSPVFQPELGCGNDTPEDHLHCG